MDQLRILPNTPGPQDLPELAGDLARDLAALGSRNIEVPRDIDDAVMAAARSALSERRRGRIAARRWARWTAAAAGLALVVWIGSLRSRQPIVQPAALRLLASVPGDLDRSGRVDILDAFALARQLDSNIAPTLGDFNGDGRIDHADVDAIAMAAVRLTEGTS